MIDHFFERPIGEFVLQEKLGESTFSVVYSGLQQTTLETRAFRIARGAAQLDGRSMPTRALTETSGGIFDADVDPVSILARQFEFLERMNGSSIFPSVDRILQFDGATALQMQFIPWRCLRDRMTQGKLADTDLIMLADHLIALEKSRVAHGDLKPDNILIGREAVRFVDPGYFGQMALRDGSGAVVMVTTPEYYPLLRPDDMSAVGYLLIELITGTNVLHQSGKAPLPGPSLARRLDLLELRKNRFLVPIGHLNRDTELAEKLAASSLHPIALRALGMTWNAVGEIDVGPRYSSFAEMRAELAAVLGAQQIFSPAPEEDEQPLRVLCFHCDKPLVGDSDTCPSCGAYLAAPACPRCRNPVSRDKDRRAFYKYEKGRYAWNYRWDGRCAECGFDFAAELQLTDDRAIEIRAVENARIEVKVTRATERSTITLTPDELHAIFEQLNGPLHVLMQRRKWSRDTT